MTVAVKVLIRQSVTDVERMRREASLVQAIDHQNVVRLIEVGESEGLHFMVMEFIPETLSNLIDITGALPVERAVALAIGISDRRCLRRSCPGSSWSQIRDNKW